MKFSYLLFLLFTVATDGIAQKTKKVTKETGEGWSKIKLAYFVLAENIDIKHGSYEKSSNGKVESNGYYKMNKKDSLWTRFSGRGEVVSQKEYSENKKTGTWKFYMFDGKLEWQYDFSADTGRGPDLTSTYMYQVANGEWIREKVDKEAQMLTGRYEWQQFLNRTLRYPQEAIDRNIQGITVPEVTIDENGNVVDWGIAESVHRTLDNEALRVLKLFDPEFIPAEKNGKKVKAKVKVPIVFRLARG